MNKYLKSFFHRGFVFGGFGPIITGIIYFIISLFADDFIVSGKEMVFAIISTYILAFMHAGASVFNQIEEWSIVKSVFFHFITLYFAYVFCYLFNDWLEFDLRVIMVFTAIFAVVYLVIWITVVTLIKITEKHLNAKLK
ncbi:MAG: DUF3021 domain-containing protein [Ruminococcaceae bacterium]|nr:DUF3021 domain-containing protein [Oscillospiraceae bacterium]